MNRTRSLLRGMCVVGAGTLISAIGLPAQAQVRAQSQEREAVSESLTSDIVVTGSRIQTGMTTATPVTAVTAEELKTLSPGPLMQGITQLPQFYGSTTPQNPGLTIASPGPGALSLRGLGANRTLVLLNGRRLPSASRYGSADVNTIPETFIKQVDTITGGASAAYGTDAIAGVVNFSLDTAFTGLEVNLQNGITERGDNSNWKASIAGGVNIGDRGHLLLSGEYQKSEGITNFRGRNWYKGANFVPQPGSTPYYLLRDNVVSTDATLDGLIQTFFPPAGIGLTPIFPGGPPVGLVSSLNNLAFNPDGSFAPFQFGDPVGMPLGGGAQSITNGGSGTDIGADRYDLLPSFDRANLFAYAEYEVFDDVKLFAQGSYGHSHVDSLNPGGGLFLAAWPLQIYADNAFLPDSIRQQMQAEGLDSVALFRVGSVQDLADSHTIADNDIYSGTIGFEAVVPEGGLFGTGLLGNWKANAYYQRSRTDFIQRQTKATRTDRYPLAVDAVVDPVSGNIVCNVTLYSSQYDDCVPLNPFGRGNASQAAIDYVTGYDVGKNITTPIYYTDTGYSLGVTDSYISTADKVSLGHINQNVVELTLNGELFRGIGAGPFMAAFGGSYRKETINQIVRAAGGNPANDPNVHPVPANDPANGIRGFPDIFISDYTDAQFSDVPNIRGSLDVKELFGELLLPLIQDQPFMKQLNVSGAVRWADYSASGGIWAWKLGIDAEIADGFRLRGTMSRDVRAANFSELYEATAGAEQIYDPVKMATKTAFFSGGGNPNLAPETSKTLTMGAVFSPSWLRGVSVSVDWYDIKVNGAIGTLSSNDILQACFDGDSSLCSLIVRDPTTNEVERVHRNYLNLNQLHVNGIDVEAAYSTSIKVFGGGNERLSTRLFLSWLGENSITLATGAKTDYVGQVGYAAGAGGNARSLPEWKATANVTYSNGPFSLTLQERFIGSGFQNPNPIPGITDIDRNKVSAILYSDIRMSYQFMDGRFELNGSVTNLTDTAPPSTPSGNLILLAPYNTALYDVLGRRFVVGAKVRF